MANPEHMEMLKQGVQAWNAWRNKHLLVQPDLSGANLSDAHLSRAYLHGADFSQADLSGADLIRANLSYADLSHSYLSRAYMNGVDLTGAHLKGADLRGACLIDADLRGTYLREANLGRANLSGADFSRADLSGADFAGTILRYSMFADNDLSEVKGLESTWHVGPTYLSIDTFYKSGGNIPEVFLRGCGLPETFILQTPVLVATLKSIQFYSCFISYSGLDQGFAGKLYADIQSEGVRCWFAPHDLKIGDRIRDRVDKSIRLHDKLLLILSKNSVSSQWVEDEVEAAFEREQRENRTVLFPIRIDNDVMSSGKAWAANIRRTRHIGDFTIWKDDDSYRKAVDRLLRDLRANV